MRSWVWGRDSGTSPVSRMNASLISVQTRQTQQAVIKHSRFFREDRTEAKALHAVQWLLQVVGVMHAFQVFWEQSEGT